MARVTTPDGLRATYEHKRLFAAGMPHLRSERDGRESGYKPLGKGGETICRLRDSDGEVVSVGVARCDARDNFDRKLGRVIAHGRAVRGLEHR